ncbi:hypothetical protein JTB14_021664 [Gonioctena quinquepunctata]|nr:hypothetical protein JTB14_021664 [Gonioctena quinquepunctata]
MKLRSSLKRSKLTREKKGTPKSAQDPGRKQGDKSNSIVGSTRCGRSHKLNECPAYVKLREEFQEDWSTTLQISGKPNVFLKFELDTVAQASIIPKYVFEKIPDCLRKLEKSDDRLLNYNGSRMKNLGLCNSNCRVENKSQTHNLKFEIVETDNNSSAILGLFACQKLNLIKRLNETNLE